MDNCFINLIEFIKSNLESGTSVYIGVRHDDQKAFFGVICKQEFECTYPLFYQGQMRFLNEALLKELTKHFPSAYPLIFGAPDGSLDYLLAIDNSIYVDFPCDNQVWIYAKAAKDDYPPIEVYDTLFPGIDDEIKNGTTLK